MRASIIPTGNSVSDDNLNAQESAQPAAPVTGFDIGLDASTDVTYDIPFAYDANGATIAAITVVGKNSQKYKDAERKLTRVALKKSAVRGRPLDLKRDADSDEFIEQREATNLELAIAATTGWFGLTNAGAEYVFSPENARALYTKNVVVRDKVLAAVEDAANFLKR